MTSIRLAETDADIERTYDVMVQLRPHIPREGYVDRIRRMQTAGFLLAMVEYDGAVTTAAGFRIMEQLVVGRVLYVDDLITDENLRSSGHGGQMLQWLRDYAKAENCASFELDSGVWRAQAHRFYFRHGMTIMGFHFKVEL